MRLFVLLWIVSIGTLEGEKQIYNGTLNDCMINSLEFNNNQKKALAFCVLQGGPTEESPPERKRGDFDHKPEEHSY